MTPKLIMLLVALAMADLPPTQEPVRMQIAREQQQSGLTLASFYRNLVTLNFADRSFATREIQLSHGSPSDGAMSRDGSEIALQLSVREPFRIYLGTIHSDGSGYREYPDIVSPSFLCWSYDKTRLAAEISVKRSDGSRGPQLAIINLPTGDIHEFDGTGYLTSQCWSPNGEEIVYVVADHIRIFNLNENKWRELAKGNEPTWSPDGNWISFVNHDSYNLIRPTGTDQKLLFKSKEPTRSGLWWSPDSSIVAYLALSGHWFNHTDFVARRLRVRRLADNSEDWLSEGADVGYIPSFQWIQPRAPRL